MKTKHLNQLIADVSVALFHAEAKVTESFGNDEVCQDAYLTAVKLKRLLKALNMSVHAQDRSYLLDLGLAGNIAAALNHVGYSFKMPSCEGLLKLTLDIADRTFTGNKEFAQSFFLQMVHPGVSLNNQELAAAQAALCLLEDEL